MVDPSTCVINHLSRTCQEFRKWTLSESVLPWIKVELQNNLSRSCLSTLKQMKEPCVSYDISATRTLSNHSSCSLNPLSLHSVVSKWISSLSEDTREKETKRRYGLQRHTNRERIKVIDARLMKHKTRKWKVHEENLQSSWIIFFTGVITIAFFSYAQNCSFFKSIFYRHMKW